MKNNIVIPTYAQLIENTFIALKELGGSGKNTEINDKVAQLMNLPDDVLDVPYLNSSSMSEVNYRCAWARTLLKNHGAIENSARSVWAITAAFASVETVDGDYIEKNCKKPSQTKKAPAEVQMENAGVEIPEEVRSWRRKLQDVIQNMDPYGFERLTQRLLRECGFTQVEVTKKSGDGGIDGAGDIRDFRGSLTTNIEKGVFISTGSFSKAASEEAAAPGKKQIDLIDGEEFITKLAECGIGVHEIKDYEIVEDYFAKI